MEAERLRREAEAERQRLEAEKQHALAECVRMESEIQRRQATLQEKRDALEQLHLCCTPLFCGRCRRNGIACLRFDGELLKSYAFCVLNDSIVGSQ